MVRITGPLHSLRAQKQFGHQIVFKQKGSRSIATNYSTPGSKNKFTPNATQIKKRATYGTAVEAWNALTANAKAEYNARAKYKNYSGWNLFLKEYMQTPPFSMYGTRIYGIFIYGKAL